MAKKIMTLHPKGKEGVNIDRQKYEQVKEAITACLKAKGELTFSELTREVEAFFDGSFEGSIPWYTVTVKQDLEARGQLAVSKGHGPQRISMST